MFGRDGDTTTTGGTDMATVLDDTIVGITPFDGPDAAAALTVPPIVWQRCAHITSAMTAPR
jgi:hypothetical protein